MITREEKLAQELEKYRQLASENEKIDIATLAMQALEKRDSDLIPYREKRWAYLIALVLPPFGLIFAVKFYLSGKSDGKQSAWICITLTAVALILFVLLGKILLAGSSTSIDQLQQINPQDIEQLYQ